MRLRKYTHENIENGVGYQKAMKYSNAFQAFWDNFLQL